MKYDHGEPIMAHNPLYKSLLCLREHAIVCGHKELAHVLTRSLLRLSSDEVAERLVDIIKRAKDGCGNE